MLETITNDEQGVLEELSEAECLDLLATRSIGRLAVAVSDAAPLVVPVNFVLDGETLVFRSGSGTKLDALREQPVSFQVDEIDPFHRTGWSVLLRGAAVELNDDETQHLSVEPWAPGDRDRWMRIVPTTITGRRIHLPDLPVETRGYI